MLLLSYRLLRIVVLKLRGIEIREHVLNANFAQGAAPNHILVNKRFNRKRQF